MKKSRLLVSLIIVLIIAMSFGGCGQKASKPEEDAAVETAEEDAAEESDSEEDAEDESASDENAEEDAAVEKNGEIMILFTSDAHCGYEEGFGYAGVSAVRDSFEAQGYTTILVDNGDAIQGEAAGMLTKGASSIRIMNQMKYDVAIPGNHEFDYGADEFLEIAKSAEFPYICCNLTKDGEPVFPSYIIKEVEGIRIGFVGVTTPASLTESNPTCFLNEAGENPYDFCQDGTGEALVASVQKAVDQVRAEGVDYVYLLAHLGMASSESIWSYENIIGNTNGIDVLLDGHKHDTEQVVMKNKDGKDVVRSACGTKLNALGYSHITPTDGIVETGIWSWNNDIVASELFGISNDVSKAVNDELAMVQEITNQVVAKSAVELTIFDPVEVDATGSPIRIVRQAETNLGDLCADALRATCDADIGLINGGGVRTVIEKGDISYGDIIDVFPFNNQVCMIEATGQQILDALEWGANDIPAEFGGFLQVSGLTYEIDATIPSPCEEDENQMCVAINGERRVKNVTVGGEPLDPAKTYTVAGIDYILLNNGNGFTAFDEAKVVYNLIKTDNQALIDYIVDNLGGEIGSEYQDPYGQGRIVIFDGREE